jgi:hypothetical protein
MGQGVIHFFGYHSNGASAGRGNRRMLSPGRRMVQMSDENNQLLSEIDGVIKVMQWGYYTWFGVYLLFVILTAGLPLIAALGVFGNWWGRVLAGAGTLAVALLHAIKPNEYASAYDAGVQLAWKTRVALLAGRIDKASAGENLERAIDLTTFRYSIPFNEKQDHNGSSTGAQNANNT